jgi:putative ABC transport system permease protein
MTASRRPPPLRPSPLTPPEGGAVDAEIAFHFDETIEALVDQGWSPPQARAEAERRFGDRRRYRRDLDQINRATAKRRGRTLMWDSMRQNLRDAIRGLRRAPGAALAVVSLLALGIGANATMFDIVDRLMLRPPDHLVDADRLRLVYAQRPTLSLPQFARGLTYPDVEDLRHLPALAAVSAFTQPSEMTLGAGRDAEKVRVQLAEASYFTTLGVQPRLGRFYGAREDDIGAAPTAVLSETFWETRYGRDPQILGRVLTVGSGRHMVVGVAPRGFTGADLSAVDIWVPLRTTMTLDGRSDSLKTRTWWWANAVIRLKPGVSDEAAAAQMTTAHVTARREVERQGGEAYLSKGPAYLYTASMIVARRPNPSKTASISLSLAVVSLIVLLVACANVANLLLTRGIQLRRELAVRVALGAERRRLVALVLTEAAVLAAAGAAASLVVSRWSGMLARSYLPDITFSQSALGTRLLVFNLVAAALTILLAGLLPALQAARTSAADALRGSSRGASAARSRLRDALMVGQTALSVVLLVGAGLFVRSLYRAANADVGFDRAHVIVATFEGEPGMQRAQRDEVYFTALERARTMPGVRRAALSIESTIAFGGWSGPGGIITPGGKLIDDLPDGGPFLYSGTEGFFETLGVPIVKGRSFTAQEYVDGAEPVGMVSETFVRQLWPDRDPIGQCFQMAAQYAGRIPPQPCRRVVGVFRDFARQGLADKGTIAVAIPNRPDRKSPQALVVRVDGDPSATAPLIRQMMAGLSTDIRFVQVDTMAERVDELLEPWKLGATMFVVFGGLALIVAGVGLYSLLAFGVATRRRELGIRAALGARRGHLIGMVLRQAGALLLAGVLAGTALALVAGRFVERLLFDGRAADPGVYALVTIVLLTAGALASSIPAWRATTVSPTAVLKEE